MACYTCNKSSASLNCGICQESVCKSCAQILPEDAFSFLAQIPENLQHKVFCGPCFDQHVSADLMAYEENMEKAREILVYEKSQSKETRLIKRIEKPVKVLECPDREEAVLRLAFFAAQKNYNSIIDVDVVSSKVGTGSYQKMTYKASGIPANVTTRQLVKDRSIWSNPN